MKVVAEVAAGVGVHARPVRPARLAGAERIRVGRAGAVLHKPQNAAVRALHAHAVLVPRRAGQVIPGRARRVGLAVVVVVAGAARLERVARAPAAGRRAHLALLVDRERPIASGRHVVAGSARRHRRAGLAGGVDRVGEARAGTELLGQVVARRTLCHARLAHDVRGQSARNRDEAPDATRSVAQLTLRILRGGARRNLVVLRGGRAEGLAARAGRAVVRRLIVGRSKHRSIVIRAGRAGRAARAVGSIAGHAVPAHQKPSNERAAARNTPRTYHGQVLVVPRNSTPIR